MSTQDVYKLKELAESDATVRQYFRLMDANQIPFEEMVVKLAIQLSAEKKELRKKLRNSTTNNEAPRFIGLG